MTQGMKSSEFITAILTVLSGLTCIILGSLKGLPELTNTGTYLMLGGTVGHSVSRGLAKFGTNQTPAAPEPKAEEPKAP